MDDSNSDDIIFSSLFACPECGHSIPELEPRLFSFNNPAGACDNCDGLGVKQYFDEKRVIVDDNLTIGEGAIRRWDRRNSYYFQLLNSLGEHYGFDMDTPGKSCRRKSRKSSCTAAEPEKITFTFVNERGDNFQRSHKFEGILPNMERRFRETESQAVREDFAKYLSTQNCPDCEGTRLRKDARHVFIDKLTLPEITTMTIAGAGDYFDGLKFKGKKKDIAEKILKEIQDRLRFLIDVGLNYLTLNRSAETLSGGEAQRIRFSQPDWGRPGGGDVYLG